MKWLKSLLLILTLILFAVLAALSVNQDEITLRFAIWETPLAISIFWWLLAAFVIGVVFGVLASLWAGFQRRLETRRLRQSLAQANAELNRLRDLTIQG